MNEKTRYQIQFIDNAADVTRTVRLSLRSARLLAVGAGAVVVDQQERAVRNGEEGGHAQRAVRAAGQVAGAQARGHRHRRLAARRRCHRHPGHTRWRAAAQRVSSLRLDSCSLRSTAETWVSTVLMLMNSSEAHSR